MAPVAPPVPTPMDPMIQGVCEKSGWAPQRGTDELSLQSAAARWQQLHLDGVGEVALLTDVHCAGQS